MNSVMKFVFAFGLGLHLCMPAAARVPITPGSFEPIVDPSVIYIQQQELPEIVQLLLDRAQRAERRGDMATAAELYDAIRDLGYVVLNRPGSGTSGRQNEDSDRPRRWWEGGASSGGATDDNDDHGDDDDNGDDDGNDGGDDGDDGDDSDDDD